MPDSLVLLFVVTGLAAFIQGFSGFGFGIVVMVLLSLAVDSVDMERASVFVSLTIVVAVLVIIICARKKNPIDWKQVWLLFIGILIFTPLGYGVVSRWGKMPRFRLLFGVILILFALNGLLRPHIKRHIHNLFAPVFGGMGGFLSGALSSGGPPLVLYLYSKEDDPRTAIGTLQVVFMIGTIYRILYVEFFGNSIGLEIIKLSTWCVPVIVVATVLGRQLTHRVSPKKFLQVVYVLLAFGGVMNIVRGVA